MTAETNDKTEEVSTTLDTSNYLNSDAARSRAESLLPPEHPTVELVEETKTATVFQLWVEKCIHNSKFSEHTESYNYLLTQLPELEAMLNEESK